MHLPFDGGEARGVAHQTFEPLRLAFAQDSSRLVRHGGRRRDRGTVRTTKLALLWIPAHWHFGLNPHFHRGLLRVDPAMCTAILADNDLFGAAFWDQTPPNSRSRADTWNHRPSAVASANA